MFEGECVHIYIQKLFLTQKNICFETIHNGRKSESSRFEQMTVIKRLVTRKIQNM